MRALELSEQGAIVSANATVKALLLALAAAGLFAAAGWRMATTPGPRDLQRLSSDAPARLSAFVDGTGAAVSIDSFRGKVVILNLWAAWCVPCLQEMPSLDRLAARLPDDQFAIVAVSQDKNGVDAAKRAFAKLGLQRLKFYLDPAGKLGAEIGARGMPTTLILGADSVPLSFREGAATWDSDEMIAYLHGLAARKGGADKS